MRLIYLQNLYHIAAVVGPREVAPILRAASETFINALIGLPPSSEFSEGRKKMAWMPVNAKLILNPTSGAPGFIMENVFCLPGVPSILQSMLGALNNEISGGKPIISHTINLRTVESEIAKSLTSIQDNNKDVEIGSYPFFKAGKLGVAIVIRSEEQSKIDICNSQILDFVNQKNIQIINNE